MYFPRPYPDELLYSAIARCRVHLGLDSHKGLLSLLFSDTKVAAVTDLPTHLGALVSHVGEGLHIDAERLARDHTLYPLYAHFIPHERQRRLLVSMVAGDIPGSLGLAGITTALIKWPPMLRYCPLCLAEMMREHGEFYWCRRWQAKGADACPTHRCVLLHSSVPFRRVARHEFLAASPNNCPEQGSPVSAEDGVISIAEGVRQLLGLPDLPAPNYCQWSYFYKRLATEHDARKGGQVRSDLLWERILKYHSKAWLMSSGLFQGTIPPWFMAMFRKHRKAFSYLQHLVVWSALRPGVCVGTILGEARSLPPKVAVTACSQERSDKASKMQICQYRNQWIAALEQANEKSAKHARITGGQAVYAWLYRHDRDWLLVTNNKKHSKRGNHSQVDWVQRDRCLVRRLLSLESNICEELHMPRRSRNWYIGQLPHHASVERHIDRMPLCRAFLDRYVESVGEYQIRRLTRQIISDSLGGTSQRIWELERLCGLQKNRTTELTRRFIKLIEGN